MESGGLSGLRAPCYQHHVDGAICARHPGRTAVYTCPRCGNFACEHCAFAVGERVLCPGCAGTTPLPILGTVRLAGRLLRARWLRALRIAWLPWLLSLVPGLVLQFTPELAFPWNALIMIFPVSLWQFGVAALLAVLWYREVLMGTPTTKAPADPQLSAHCLRHVGMQCLLALPEFALGGLVGFAVLEVLGRGGWLIATPGVSLTKIANEVVGLVVAYLLVRATLRLPSIAVDGPPLRGVWDLSKGSATRIFLVAVAVPEALHALLSFVVRQLPTPALLFSPLHSVIQILGLTTLALAYQHVVVVPLRRAEVSDAG